MVCTINAYSGLSAAWASKPNTYCFVCFNSFGVQAKAVTAENRTVPGLFFATAMAKAKAAPFVPKMGKLRHVLKREAPQKTTAWQKIPYVRHGSPTQKSHPERTKWSQTLKSIYQNSGRKLIDMLRKEKILKQWNGQPCPFCVESKLRRLRFFSSRGFPNQCRRKSCRQYVMPHAFHKVFSTCGGKQAPDLQDQAAVLICLACESAKATAHKLTGKNHKMIGDMSRKLAFPKKECVEKQDKNIKFGESKPWKGAEGDEVDFRKEIVDGATSATPATFEQWAGFQERGDNKTLMLFRLPTRKTHKRAPGPGPILQIGYKKIAMKHFKDRKIILHTDGAKDYKLEVPGVWHDNVVHKPKRVNRVSKMVWIKPKHVRLYSHEMKDGTKVFVKCGTPMLANSPCVSEEQDFQDALFKDDRSSQSLPVVSLAPQ